MSDTQHQAISDDQELAQVLQGMQQQTRTMADHDPEAKGHDEQAAPAMQYEEAPAPNAKGDAAATADAPAEPAHSDAAPTSEMPPVAPAVGTGHKQAASVNPALEALKKEALEELRPLAARLDLPAKEKFDTMLLIIRSTDDQNLLEPAHEAAKSIDDDMQRAEALLDIVKEIDYFAGQGQK